MLDSIMSSIESSLYNGPVSFDCYPNLIISFKDKNILQTIILQIKTYNYNILEGLISIALIFKIHYKAMFSFFANKHKFQSQKGETLLLQTNLSKSNIVVPRAIQQKDVTLPEDWVLERASQLEPQQPLQLNVLLKQINEYNDRKVELTFHKHSTNSRLLDESSSSNTLNLGRIFKMLSVINIPYHTNPSRKINI